MERYFPDCIKITPLKEILLFSCSFFTFINYYCDRRNRTDRLTENALFYRMYISLFRVKEYLISLFSFHYLFYESENESDLTTNSIAITSTITPMAQDLFAAKRKG